MIEVIVVSILIFYFIVSIVVYFLANSNVIPSRRNKEYEIGFNASLRFLPSELDPEKEVAYWQALHPDNRGTAIFLHGFTRTSDKLQKRAQIYWERGYNLYFIDNLGHGYSSDQLYPSGYRYSREILNVINAEDIEKPILHGLSMGAIAANVIAQTEPDLPRAIICEALPKDFDNLYKELLNYLKVPYILFPWIEWVSKKIAWKQFEQLDMDEDDYKPSEVNCPMYLIHSATDTLFNPDDHFWPIVAEMKDRENFKYTLFPSSRHTDMDKQPSYRDEVEEFLDQVENVA